MDENRKAILVVQEYIEEHLTDSITLSELGKVAGYSVFHLERMFKDIIGISLFSYIRKLRLTEAAKTLRDDGVKVIDTALNFMFDSHEGFTRAFSKEFGISPYKYKTDPIPVQYFIAYKITIQALRNRLNKENKEMEAKTIFTQVIERPRRKAIIKRGIKATNYFEYCEEVGCDIWGMLTSVKEALFEPAGFWLSNNLIKQGTSQYVQGVEVTIDYMGAIPDGFELITLEPCLYIIFNGEPYDDENFEEEVELVMNKIEKFNPELYGYAWENTSPRFQLEPRGERGYIEAKPVKAIKNK